MKKFSSFLVVVFIFLLGLGASGRISEVSESPSFQVPTAFKHNRSYVVSDYSKLEEFFIQELIANNSNSYQIYDASDLSHEILENRRGVTIIERCVGMVVDEERGDGVVLNAYNPEFNYISYRRCGQDVHNGTILVSYMVYNPNTTYIDDIIERHDFVICRDYEYGVSAV